MITKDDFILITGASGFIGTNLVELFEEKEYKFINFDIAPATNVDHNKYWHKGDIMKPEQLTEAFEKYKPTVVIHLAARTDTLSDKLEDYRVNTEGTKNVVDEIKKHEYIKHALFAATQYVYKNKEIPFPIRDDDYCPHTTYGKSKMLDEQYIRNSGMTCKWTIFRPCNVWGPWHLRYPNELWKYLGKGIYVQPGTKPVIRTYAYVKNLVKQLDAIMNASDELVNHKMYYLGDKPIDSYIWLNALSKEITGKKVKRVPKFIFWMGAKVGDIMMKLGISFPLYTVRYHNMIEDFYAPSDITCHLFGSYSTSYEDNCKETIDWLRGEYGKKFDYWKDYPHGKK